MAIDKPATVAVTGAAGMLGQDVCRTAPGWARVVGLTRADADLTNPKQTQTVICEVQPDIIFHCAAYTDVDGATHNPQDAWRGNVLATRHVATRASEAGIRLLHISTDYVFDGSRDTPYTESAVPTPINVYGETKLAAEREAEAVREHLIVRTQWLYGPGGRNFVEAILDAARSGKDLQVVQNELGCPTYAPDLAEGLWHLLETPATGIVHLTNRGACTRTELARASLSEAGLDHVPVSGIDSSEWPGPTRRPLNAVLSSERLEDLGVPPLRHWREALKDYVALLLTRWRQEDA
jgi:dTDP-4-dehydrorhamnose reductase